MHILFKRKVFSRRQRHTRSGDTLDCRIVCKVDEHNRTLDCARFSEIADEEVRLFKRDADCREHDCEFCVAADDFCLSCDLSGKLCVRHTRHREHGQFLTAHESVQAVDCAYTRLNKLVGIVARNGVDGLTVDVKFHLGYDRRATVTGSAHTVKNSAQHIFAHAELDAVSKESGF